MEEGSFYHIYNRGNNKERLFFEAKNYVYFLQKFDQYLSAYADVYAYCLMPNHFHFLIKIKEVPGQASQERKEISEVAPEETSEVSPAETSEVLKTSEVLAALKTSEVLAALKTSAVLSGTGSKKLTPLEKAFKDFFICYAKSINKAHHRTGSLFQSKFKKKLITEDSYFTSLVIYIHANPLKAKLCTAYEDYTYSSYKAILDTGHTKIIRAEVLDWFGSRKNFIQAHEQQKLD